MPNAGDWTVKITLDSSGMVKGVDRAESSLDDLGKTAGKAERELGKTEGALDKTGRSAGRAAADMAIMGAKVGALTVATAAAAAAGATLVATFNSISQGIQRGGRFDDLSAQLGVTVEALTSVEILLRDSGVSIESYGIAIRTLSKNLFDFANNTGEARVALERLGFDQAALAGKDASEAFALISPRLAEVGNSAERTALAMKIFGEAGTQLGPLLAQSSQEVERLTKLSRDLGMTLSTDQAAVLDSVADNLDILSNAYAGVGQQIAVGLGPGLNAALEAAINLAAELINGGNSAREFGEGLGDIFYDLAGDLDGIRERISGMDFEEAFDEAFSDLGGWLATRGLQLGGRFVGGFVDAFLYVDPEELARQLGPEGLEEQARKLLYGGFGEAGADVGAEFVRRFGEAAIDKLPAELQKAIRESIAAAERADALAEARNQFYGESTGSEYEPIERGTEATDDLSDALQRLRDAQLEQIGASRESNAELLVTAEVLESAAASGLTLAEAERELAVALIERRAAEIEANTNSIEIANQYRETALAALDLKDRVASARGDLQKIGDEAMTFAEVAEDGFVDLGATIKGAFDSVFDALVSGTLDLEDAMRSLGLAIGKDFFNAILEDKLNFDLKVQGNFLDLGKFGESVFGGIFSGAAAASNLGSFLDADDAAGGMWENVFGGVGPQTQTAQEGMFRPEPSPVFEDSTSVTGAAAGLGGLFSDDGPLGEVGGALGDFGGAIGDVIGGIGQMAGALGAVSGVAMMLVEVFSMLFQQAPTRGTMIRMGMIDQLQGENAQGAFGGLGRRGVMFDVDLTGDIAGGARDPQTGVVPFGSGYNRSLAYGQLGMLPFGNPQFDENGRLINPTFTGTDDESMYVLGAMGIGPGFPQFRGSTPSEAQRRRFDEDLAGRENLYPEYQGFDPSQTLGLFGGAASVGALVFGADRQDPGALYDASFSAGVVWVQGFTDALNNGMTPEDAYKLANETMLNAARAAGIDLGTALADISNIYVDAIAYQRDSDSPTSEDENMAVIAAQLGTTIAGGIELFSPDFARGTQTQIAVLQSFQHAIRDANGEVLELTGPVLDSLSPALQQALVDGTATFEQMAEIFEKYIAAGFELDPETVKRKLAAIGASAQSVTESFAATLRAGPTTAFEVMADITSRVRDQIISAFDEEVTGQLLEATNLAGAFADVFEVIQNIGEYDLLGGGGAQFTADLRDAIASGKENLEFYAPQIREAVRASKELREVLDELFAPSELESFFMELEKRVDSLKGDLRSGISSAIDAGRDAFEESMSEQERLERANSILGIATDPVSVEQATRAGRDAFATAFRDDIRSSVTDAIMQAMIDAAIKKAVLAPLLAQLEVETAAAMEDGVIDPIEAARLTALGDNIIYEGDRAARQLAPIFAQLLGIEYDATILDEQEREIIELAKKHGVLPADLAAFAVAAQGVDPDALTRYFELLMEQQEPYRELARNIRLYSKQIRDSVDEDTLTQFLKQVEGVDPDALTRYFAWLVEEEKRKKKEAEDAAQTEAEARAEVTVAMENLRDASNDAALANTDATATVRELTEAMRGLIGAAGGNVPGAATGGTFRGGSAVVGEAGRPELVTALPGRGFRVTPLSWSGASRLMGRGLPGFAEGGMMLPDVSPITDRFQNDSGRDSGRAWVWIYRLIRAFDDFTDQLKSRAEEIKERRAEEDAAALREASLLLAPSTDGWSSAIASAVQQGMVEGASTQDTINGVKAAVITSTIDGLVQGFLVSSVILPVIEPYIQAIANIIGMAMSGEITISTAGALIQLPLAAISQIMNSPEMKAALELTAGVLAELRAMLPEINTVNSAASGTLDQVERAQKAQCDLVEQTVALGEIGLGVGGRGAPAELVRYVPREQAEAEREAQNRATAQAAFDQFIAQNYPELVDVQIAAWGLGTPEQRARKAARSDFYAAFPEFDDVQVYARGGLVTRPTLGLVGEAGPELIVPLSNVGAAQSTRGLSQEVRGLREDLRRVASAIESQPIDVALRVDGRDLHAVVDRADRVSRRVRSSISGGR